MEILDAIKDLPAHMLCAGIAALIILAFFTLYILLHIIAPKPRLPLPSEKQYQTTTPDGGVVKRQLPCWHDRWLAERHANENHIETPDSKDVFVPKNVGSIEPASLHVSVVMPAYNEEKRILSALEEAVEYLDAHFGRDPHDRTKTPNSPRKFGRGVTPPDERLSGYEILVVNDGSRDKTVDVVLEFSRTRGLHDILRVVTLEKNRGKGGAVTHGLRHVRGEYAIFADADGASKFSDLGRLLDGCMHMEDDSGRGVAIGSRGHLVGSEAVVKRSALRNLLMRCFHMVLMILTPPATSRLRDTQCGFKLFSRAALPHIVPYMHIEGWIFDIEMLMLAESAPAVPVLGSDGTVIGSSPGIKVAEVPIDWEEVPGSKLNVIQDSVKMAIGLAVLRASWMMGVYRRRLT